MFPALLASAIKILVLNIKVSIQDQKFLSLIEFEYLSENLKKAIKKYVNFTENLCNITVVTNCYKSTAREGKTKILIYLSIIKVFFSKVLAEFQQNFMGFL